MKVEMLQVLMRVFVFYSKLFNLFVIIRYAFHLNKDDMSVHNEYAINTDLYTVFESVCVTLNSMIINSMLKVIM